MSLDRKRSALFAVSEALWDDLAQDLDDGPFQGGGPDDRDDDRYW
jgi:hypothetical protein